MNDHQRAALDYARQALGDAKAEGPREPEERATPERSEQVERLRHLAQVGADSTEPETTTEDE